MHCCISMHAYLEHEYTKHVILNHGKSGVGIWFKHVQLM